MEFEKTFNQKMGRRKENIIPIDCPHAKEQTQTRYCPEHENQREKIIEL